eukprot:5852567-Prymnesium_polylepis.1
MAKSDCHPCRGRSARVLNRTHARGGWQARVRRCRKPRRRCRIPQAAALRSSDAREGCGARVASGARLSSPRRGRSALAAPAAAR